MLREFGTPGCGTEVQGGVSGLASEGHGTRIPATLSSETSKRTIAGKDGHAGHAQPYNATPVRVATIAFCKQELTF